MPIYQVIVLAIVQGLAELLPVSSSAHVVVAEKLMGLDPTSPQMTLLLVMLHTGTMLSVIAYFWREWKHTYFASADEFKRFAIRVVYATALTAVVGEGIIKVIEHTIFKGQPQAQIEDLFGRLDLIAPALACVGILILVSGRQRGRRAQEEEAKAESLTRRPTGSVTMRQAGWIGFVQGLALPFRGFSRSGATISTGLLTGATKERSERFSFALAVVLTPAVVAQEALRLVKATHAAAATGAPIDLHRTLLLSLMGAGFSFVSGLTALRWLNNWLVYGRWYMFGIYCLMASAVVFYLYLFGY
jgi:undecaprenyl-diphosphatase